MKKFTDRGSTALYDAIGKTFQKLDKSVKNGEKVLVNIYTDGQENSSREFTAQLISRAIEDLKSKGYTVTFIGTNHDVAYVVHNLKIHESNTLAYDGSGAGLDKAMTLNSTARSNYSAKLQKGEDVSLGFYKDVK